MRRSSTVVRKTCRRRPPHQAAQVVGARPLPALAVLERDRRLLEAEPVEHEQVLAARSRRPRKASTTLRERSSASRTAPSRTRAATAESRLRGAAKAGVPSRCARRGRGRSLRRLRVKAGIASGGSSRSQSMTTVQRPRLASGPAVIAAGWPKLRLRRTPHARVAPREPAQHVPGAVLAAIVDEHDLERGESASRADDEPFVQPPQAARAAVDGDDDGQLRRLVIGGGYAGVLRRRCSRPATPSLIYRSPLVYGLAMAVLYGRYYRARSRSVAALVPRRERPRALLRPRHAVPGLPEDQGRALPRPRSQPGVRRAAAPARRRRRGGRRGRRRAAPARGHRPHPGQPLPLPPRRAPADRPHARRRAADGDRQRAGAQPGHSRRPLVARLAGASVSPGDRHHSDRFTEASLDALMAGYGDGVCESRLIPGGRDKIYVLRGTADADL